MYTCPACNDRGQIKSISKDEMYPGLEFATCYLCLGKGKVGRYLLATWIRKNPSGKYDVPNQEVHNSRRILDD